MYRPRFTISPELLRLLTQAAELRAWIAQSVIDVPWLPALQRDAAARLAHSSTAIEGNPLSLKDAEDLASGRAVGARGRDEREVANYLAAVRWVWNCKPGRRATEKDILRLHALLTFGLLDAPGRYKTRPNRVVDAGGRTVYTPPGPEQASPLTKELLDWVASSEDHPVIVNAVAHHRLVSIHPFADGNGRIARLLGTWLLYSRGFDTKHLFALDEYYEADRALYYAKLQQARELDDDLSLWLEYVAQGVVETLERTRRRIESLRSGATGPAVRLSARQEELLRLLRDRGSATSPDIQRALDVTRARVGQLLKPLVDAGLVVMDGRGRATRYHLAP